MPDAHTLYKNIIATINRFHNKIYKLALSQYNFDLLCNNGLLKFKKSGNIFLKSSKIEVLRGCSSNDIKNNEMYFYHGEKNHLLYVDRNIILSDNEYFIKEIIE